MKEEKEQTAIEKTLAYLNNYHEMKRYINEAVYEASQITDIQYNISAEHAYFRTIQECRVETIILFENLNRSLRSLREDAEAAGEGYKYEALESIYIQGMSYADVAIKMNCGRNSPKRWCRNMVQRLSVKLFGVKALEDERIKIDLWSNSG